MQTNRGIDLASYTLPFGRIWYRNPKAIKSVIFSAGRIMLWSAFATKWAMRIALHSRSYPVSFAVAT
jgi:hypothetical protein